MAVCRFVTYRCPPPLSSCAVGSCATTSVCRFAVPQRSSRKSMGRLALRRMTPLRLRSPMRTAAPIKGPQNRLAFCSASSNAARAHSSAGGGIVRQHSSSWPARASIRAEGRPREREPPRHWSDRPGRPTTERPTRFGDGPAALRQQTGTRPSPSREIQAAVSVGTNTASLSSSQASCFHHGCSRPQAEHWECIRILGSCSKLSASASMPVEMASPEFGHLIIMMLT
jgi:hypothetical protein